MDGEYSSINSTMVGNRIISINKNIYEISDVWIWKNISKGFHIWNSIARIISQLYMKRSKTNRIKNAVKSGNCKNQPFKDDSICNVKVLYWSLKKYVKNRAVHIYFEKKWLAFQSIYAPLSLKMCESYIFLELTHCVLWQDKW